MAKFTFQARQYGNTPITIEAESREAAEARLRSASPEQVRKAAEQSLRSRQSRTGISDEDISALLGGQGYTAETSGPIERARIGAGRSLTGVARGAQQRYHEMRGNPERSEELARTEENERETFGQLDNQGVGAEDLGQFIGDAAMFLGGGSAKVGWQLLNYGLRGTVFGGAQATTKQENPMVNALVGGATGLVGTATAAALGKLVKVGGEGMFNMLGMLTAASQRNGMGLAISGSHFMQSVSRGRTSAMSRIRADRIAGRPIDPGVAAAAATSEQAVTQMTRVIGQLRGADVDKFVIETARGALRQGMDPKSGLINPRVMWRELGILRPAELNAMGPAGSHLLQLRNAFGYMARLDNWDKPLVQQAVQGIVSDPTASRALTTALMRAGSKGARETILRALGRTAASATAAAGNAALQNTAQTATGQGLQ